MKLKLNLKEFQNINKTKIIQYNSFLIHSKIKIKNKIKYSNIIIILRKYY